MTKKKAIKKIKKTKKGKRGFTLVELLVVVAIIGLMAAVALVALNSARQKARDARRVADIRQVQTALEMYYSDQNGYPSGTNIMIGNTAGAAGACIDNAGMTAACSGTVYMARTPSNPAPTNDGSCAVASYLYNSASNTTYQIQYCLGAATGSLTAGNHTATPAGL